MADRPPTRDNVNLPLTLKRRKREVEGSEYGAFIRRVLRAYSRRVAAGDVETLRDLAALADHVDQAITEAVAGLRDQGYSWSEIGSRLGISKQAAQQRWAPREGQRTPWRGSTGAPSAD